MTNIKKLDQFFEHELNSNLKEILITRDQQGKYSLFGKYTIMPLDNGSFKAFTPKHIEEYQFSSLINAASWCLLHNEKLFALARRVAMLDLKLFSIRSDIENHSRLMLGASTSRSKWLYATKLQEDLSKQDFMQEEINYHINKSKQLQEKKFTRTKRQNFKYM